MFRRVLVAAAIVWPLVALSQEVAVRTPTVALISTLGDEISIVKQRGKRASNVNDFSRRHWPVDAQQLNMAVLKGLDAALAAEEPSTRRVLLRWSANPGLVEALKEASAETRDALILQALQERLAQIPQRADWDRIEAILPRHAVEAREGLPNRLSGFGIYIKPRGNQWELADEDGIDRRREYADPERTTVNPRTGEQQQDSAYVAPFIAFERVTLDARTLAVAARRPQFSHTKFSDPKSSSMDVMDQISLGEIAAQLTQLVEQAAYRSVRGAVEVGPVRPAAQPAGR